MFITRQFPRSLNYPHWFSTIHPFRDLRLRNTPTHCGERKQNMSSHHSRFTCSPAQKRLQKELVSLIKEPPPGVIIDGESVGQSLDLLVLSINGAQGTIYEGEQFQLQFRFGPKYPFDSPEVVFVGSEIPVHPHVYSNGHICLSILTDDWSPALSIFSVCVSIISMLSSCKEKKRPPDDSMYVKTCSKNPKKTKWWYHDEEV